MCTQADRYLKRGSRKTIYLSVCLSVSIKTSTFRNCVARNQVYPMPKLFFFPLHCLLQTQYCMSKHRKYKYMLGIYFSQILNLVGERVFFFYLTIQISIEKINEQSYKYERAIETFLARYKRYIQTSQTRGDIANLTEISL